MIGHGYCSSGLHREAINYIGENYVVVTNSGRFRTIRGIYYFQAYNSGLRDWCTKMKLLMALETAVISGRRIGEGNPAAHHFQICLGLYFW
jgi:hypothetical protein